MGGNTKPIPLFLFIYFLFQVTNVDDFPIAKTFM